MHRACLDAVVKSRQTTYPMILMIGILIWGFGFHANGVIYINNIIDLQKIGNDPEYPLDGEYGLIQDIDASDTMNWNGGAGFIPIGNDTTPFTGNFNGYGYKIQNLYIDRPAENYIGLFGYINGGFIYDLTLENVSISGGYFVGGLAGFNLSGTMQFCVCTGTVIGSGDDVGGLVGINIIGTLSQNYFDGIVVGGSGMYFVGGLTGESTGNVSYCYTLGDVIGTNYIGGLIGYNGGGSVNRSFSLSNVFGNDSVGGFLGRLTVGTVEECYSTGTVTGTSSTGGLIGYIDGGTANKSYWDTQTSGQINSAGGTGKTTTEMKQKITFVDWNFEWVWRIIEEKSYPYLRDLGPYNNSLIIGIDTIQELQLIGNDTNYPLDGEYVLSQDIDAGETLNWNDGAGFIPIGTDVNGFSGKIDGKGYKIVDLHINRPDEDWVGLFRNISNGGLVTNLGLENVFVVGGVIVGALAGMNQGTVELIYSNGLVSGGETIGGLVGKNRKIMINNYSTSSVSGVNTIGGFVGVNDMGGFLTSNYSSGSVSGINYVGGFIGYNSSTGSISRCYTTGPVYGNYFVGGFIGQNAAGSILECYSAGFVRGSINAGGFAGENSDSIINCYWDMDTSEMATSDGGTGKNTEDMKKQSTYVGWAFPDIWSIEEDISYPYFNLFGTTRQAFPVKNVEIWNLSDLDKIGESINYPWNAEYYLKTDIDANETRFWNGGKGFKPRRFFTGNFYGEGRKIKELVIKRSDEFLIGLFSQTGVNSLIRDLIIENPEITGSWWVGSIAGSNLGTVINVSIHSDFSYPIIGIIGDTSVGASVGENTGLITKCYSNCDVWGTQLVGGIVGKNLGIIFESSSSGNVSGSDKVGGLSGTNASIENNPGSGIVLGNYCSATVFGNINIGGLVGTNYGRVLQNYTSGSVDGDYQSGGLVGTNETGTIYQNYSLTPVSAINESGGLVGVNNNGVISECYSAGPVTGGGSFIGGFIGKNSPGGTVMDCYWDTETSGQITSAGGEGKTTAEMKKNATFVNWDFENIWMIIEDVIYPFLRIFDEPPIITIIGDAEIGLECGVEYVDAGATASDIPDGDLTPFIQVVNSVDTHAVGDYTVEYSVMDSTGNIAIVNRIVHVVDTIPPEIMLHGNDTILVECHTEFIDPGASAIDACDGELPVNIIGTVNVNAVGEYELLYRSQDSSGNIAQTIRTITVVDTIEPDIILNGDNPITIECSTTFTDPGASAIDSCDGTLPIEISGGVNTNERGEYQIIYTAEDSSHNSSQVIRTVHVIDTVPPDINLHSDNPITVPCHTVFTPPVANATDNCDFIVSVGIISNNVNTNQSGTYQVVYRAIDGSGNEAQLALEVIVGCAEGEGTVEGIPEGTYEGEGIIEGFPEGTPEGEGTVEGIPEGTSEGEGIIEGFPEGTPEGEGTVEGIPEGTSEGEGIIEGTPEGLEGEGEKPPHSTDPNGDWVINLSELLRVIQFFNFLGYHCALQGEITDEGYMPGFDGDKNCTPHSSDYNPQDWVITLSELLRLIQFFNFGGYHACPDGEDGYCPG